LLTVEQLDDLLFYGMLGVISAAAWDRFCFTNRRIT
jgi:hypothetical protein